MKAVIYARYSPGPQQREESIEGQIRECIAFAEAQGLIVVREYIDRAQTGRTDNRVNFQRMLRDSEKKIFDVVIVWKIDRFGRSREEIAINKVKLRKNGVKVMYAKEHVPDGPEGIILESVLEGMAEYYSANLAQNVRRGMTDNALKGKVNGGPTPLGYKISPEKTYEIDPLTAPVVRDIYEKYAAGEAMKEIAKDLNSRSIKSSKGRSFTRSSLQSILSNRRYLGIYTFGDEEIAGGMPQIISTELFERVQLLMQKNKRSPARAKAKVEYLLSGKLYCGECGTPMVGESGTSRSGLTYNYYKCNKNISEKSCPKTPVNKEQLEQFVITETINNVLVDEVIDKIAKGVVRLQSEEDKNSILHYLEKQLADTQKSLTNTMRAIEMGIITDTTKERLLELESIKAELENSIDKEKILKIVVTEEQIAFFINQFRNLNMDEEDNRRRLIDTFVHSVHLYEGDDGNDGDRKIVIKYNYTGGLREISSLNGSNIKCYAPPSNLNLRIQVFYLPAPWGVWITRS